MAAGIFLVATACTSLSPVADSPSPLAASPLPSAAAPSSEPSVAASVPVVLPTETPAPAKTAKPSKPPKSVAPSGPAAPNLVVSKFVLGADRLLVGVATDLRITIKNTGTADAGSFDLALGFSNDSGGGGGFSPMPVDGLAAGDSVQLTRSINIDVAGNDTFTAEADADNVIAESNEDDNTKTLSVTAVSLPDLAFVGNGFQVVDDQTGNGTYEMDMDIVDYGPADVTDQFNIGFTYYFGASGMATFDPFQCCTTEGGPVLVSGSSRSQGVGGFHFDPGDYIVYANLDSDDTIVETDETNNEARFDLSVP